MNLVQGSQHFISVTNLKDSAGKSIPLPGGMVPTYIPDANSGMVMGAQAADGSQPFTVSDTYVGPFSFTGTLKYPDGDPVALTPISGQVITDEDVTGDLTIT